MASENDTDKKSHIIKECYDVNWLTRNTQVSKTVGIRFLYNS